jgi:hypothetical protein
MGKYKRIVLSVTLVTIFSLTACTASLLKNWGKIEPNADVTNDFEQFQIDANLNYYISGSDVYPTSILGLNKAYTLDTDLWKEIEMTPKTFADIVTHMQIRLLTCCRQKQAGFVILDDKGKKIGIWYSMLMGTIGVKMKEDNEVIIYPPREDVYIQYEEKTIDR